MTNKPIGEVIAEIKNHHKRMGDAISSADTTEWEAVYRHLISPINIIPVLDHIAAIEQRESRVTALAKDGGELFDRMAEHLEVSKARITELEQQLVAERRHSVTNAIRAFVTDDDIKALNRFAECCDDPESGGHDLEKEQVTRLEKIGALQRSGRISYITDFGDLVFSLHIPVEGE